jgi:putative chitinase
MRLTLLPAHILIVAPGNRNAAAVVAALAPALTRFGIDRTPERLGMALAQWAHESNFESVSENLNYSAQRLAQVWPHRYAQNPKARDKIPNSLAVRLAAAGPQAIANNCYANRMGNGNEASGDGWRYRGRGFTQITGGAAYRAYGAQLGLDLAGNPNLALQLPVAALIAAAFWGDRGLNARADAGDLIAVTQAINGGQNGAPDRLARYRKIIGTLRDQAAALKTQDELVHPQLLAARLFVNGVEVDPSAATIAGDTITLASGVHRITKQSRVGEKLYVQTG